MRYSFDVVIPKNTLLTQPLETKVRLDIGLLTQVIIRFKAGCHNQVSIAVFDSLEQIVPANGSLAIVGDFDTIAIPMQHDLITKPYDLIVKGWSDGTRYNHTITVWFDVIEQAKKEQGGIIQSISHLLSGEL